MPNSAKRVEIKRLRAELERVEMECGILKKSRDPPFPVTSVMSRFVFI